MPSFAEVSQAQILIDGKEVPSINSKKACDISEMAEIKLPSSVLDIASKFRVLNRIKKSSDKKDACPQTITPNTEKATFTKNDMKIPQKVLLNSSACQDKGDKGITTICIYPDETGSDELLAQATLTFNTLEAQIGEPTDKIAANGEVSFKVSITGGSQDTEIEVCYGESSIGPIEADDCPTGFISIKKNAPDIVITGLKDKTEYVFKIRPAQSTSGKSWQKSFKLMPMPTTYPLQAYDGKGGNFEYSCSQTGENGLLFISFVLLLIFLLNKKNRLNINLFLLFIILQTPSQKVFAKALNVGLLGSLYRPDLDSEKQASGQDIFPFYKCFFRKSDSAAQGPINPLIGLEFDWHLFDGFGSLQLGMGVGYTFVNGKALEKSLLGAPDCNKRLDNSKISLHMYQLRPQITYVLNQLVEYFPLAPYARASLVGHGYSFFTNAKSASEANNNKPNGFRFGYQLAVGLMLMMDFLEPSAIRDAKGQGLFEHVFLKGELSYSKIDSFGREGYQFSAKDIMGTKYPLLWTFGIVFEIP